MRISNLFNYLFSFILYFLVDISSFFRNKCNLNKITLSYEIRMRPGMVILVCVIVIDDIKSAMIHAAQKLQNFARSCRMLQRIYSLNKVQALIYNYKNA